jgi:hypothetical protein
LCNLKQCLKTHFFITKQTLSSPSAKLIVEKIATIQKTYEKGSFFCVEYYRDSA